MSNENKRSHSVRYMYIIIDCTYIDSTYICVCIIDLAHIRYICIGFHSDDIHVTMGLMLFEVDFEFLFSLPGHFHDKIFEFFTKCR